jgi:hypothetical protein
LEGIWLFLTKKDFCNLTIMDNITLADYLLLPFYLLVIYKIAYAIRNKYYPEGHAWRPYFIPGLTVKILGAIFVGFIYEYYYQGGDTLWMFFHTKLIHATLNSHDGTWLRLITHSADTNHISDARALYEMFWYDDPPTYTVACIGAIIGVFCFGKYLVISVILASVAFTGCWALFKTFAIQYPRLTKPVAIAALFMPSTIFWGSGFLKDTVCLSVVGWLVYCFFMLFEKKKIRIRYVLIIALGIFLLVLIKPYILFAFLPILVFKTLLVFKNSFKKRLARVIVSVVYFALFVWALIYAYSQIGDVFTKYSAENIATTVKMSNSYLLKQSEKVDGAGYDLGEFEPSVKGISSKIIPAINVSLFRPYIWEAKKPLTLLAALESLFFILFTLRILLTNNPWTLIKRTGSDPNLLFCLLFTLVFAFFTGITSANFGALSRYKIPLIPFFMLFLVILSARKEVAMKEIRG